jgi:hypothetical protein
MRNKFKLVFGCLGVLFVCCQGVPAAKEKAATTAMPPEQAAMMQKAIPLMTPGVEHQALDPLVGKWNASVSMWMKPGDKPQVSAGSSEMAWALNKHFIKQDYHGDMNGQPFEGIGYTGFDKVRGEYQSVWMDNMMTGMIVSSGGTSQGGKVIQQSGTFGCPMTGEKQMWTRSEMEFVSPDKVVYRSYGKDPQGKEFKGMEIVYTRTK